MTPLWQSRQSKPVGLGLWRQVHLHYFPTSFVPISAISNARARQIYNTTLTKDPRKKISLKPSEGFSSALHGDGGGGASRGAVPITPCGIDDLIKMARETLAQSQRTTAQGHWRRRIEQLLEVLQSFCGVVDIIMEHQPPATALVWGGIRFLLQVGAPLLDRCCPLFPSRIPPPEWVDL